MRKVIAILSLVTISSTVFGSELPKPEGKSITAMCSQSVGSAGDELEVTLKKVKDKDSYKGTALISGLITDRVNGVDHSRNLSKPVTIKYNSYEGLTIETNIRGITVSATGKGIQREGPGSDLETGFSSD